MNHTRLFVFSLLLVFVSSLSPVHAQNRITDSLLTVLKTEKDDTVKAKTYKALCNRLLAKNDLDNCMKYALEMKDLSGKIGYKTGTGNAFSFLGVINFRKENFAEAYKYQQLALATRKELGDRHGMAISNNGIGVVFAQQENYAEALKYFLNALQISESIHDTAQIEGCSSNIGLLNTYLGNYNEALRYDTLALHIDEKVKNRTGISTLNNNIGIIYNHQRKYADALDSYRKALENITPEENPNLEANIYGNIGNIYDHTGKYDLAMENQRRALEIMTRAGLKKGEADESINIATTLLSANKKQEAKEWFLKGVALADSIGDRADKRDGYMNLAELLFEDGDYKNAFRYERMYSDIKDSIVNDETTKKIVREQTGFEFQKKLDEQKAEQEKKNALRDAEVKRQNALRDAETKRQLLLIYFVSGILLLVLAFSFFIYRGYRQKQAANKELDSRNRKIESAYRVIEDKNREITDSINYAQHIQQAVLPEKHTLFSALPGCFVFYRPKDIVGGDFYYFRENGQNIFLAAADCTGHGVPGAFMSLVGSKELKLANEKTNSPGKVLQLLNSGLKETLKQHNDNAAKDGMDIAFVKIEPGKIIYAGANRPLWILRKEADMIEEIKPTKAAIGGFTPDMQVFEERTVNLETGDTFFIFSDGFADQFGGEKGKKLSSRKFKQKLSSLKGKTPAQKEEELVTFFENWRGDQEQVDDLLVIGATV